MFSFFKKKGRRPEGLQVFVSLGSNLGDRSTNLQLAFDRLHTTGIRVYQGSSFYETNPVGLPDGEPKFLNAAVELRVRLDPEELLEILKGLEREAGRKTDGDGKSRTLDLDILTFGDLVINTDTLTLPHPRMHKRRFVLMPLSEVAPDFVHPVLKKSVAILMAECEDKSEVRYLGNSV